MGGINRVGVRGDRIIILQIEDKNQPPTTVRKNLDDIRKR
jgi:hypothetical protein